MKIIEAGAADWPQIWPFYRQIVEARETYAYDPDLTSEQARESWMVQAPGRTVIAVEDADEARIGRAGSGGGARDGAGAGARQTVLGSAHMEANRPGPGSHVATASFMVDPAHAGRGVGRALGEYVIAWAREQGFRAIQFNAVVEVNHRAVHLWRSLGFTVIGTVPEAFLHATEGYVGLHVMHRFLP